MGVSEKGRTGGCCLEGDDDIAVVEDAVVDEDGVLCREAICFNRSRLDLTLSINCKISFKSSLSTLPDAKASS